MRVYEEATMRKADCVIVCSEVERRLLQEWGVQRSLVIPNGVDTDYFTPQPAHQLKADRRPCTRVPYYRSNELLPNAQGILWFLRSVLPELDRRSPNYKLTIVGKRPPADLLAWGRSGK